MGKSIEVVAAVIRREDRIFATERGYGEWKDWWEFPGGKMEPGETPEAALRREIREELDADIRIGRLLRTVEWDYPAFHLVLHCFLCTLAGDSLVLKEHESARWLGPADLWSVKWLPADEGLLPLLSAELLGVEPTLAEYIENQVIPQYSAFDKAHQEDHAHAVIVRALALAAHYPVDRNMVYAAAACHDIGLSGGRERHHLVSGEWIRADQDLRLYGRIVAEADRLIEPEAIIRRTIQYGLAHYPELPVEGHWQRTLDHLHEKYAEGGYLKLWIPESPNAAKLRELRRIISDTAELRRCVDRIVPEETK